jgi:hypothetical protein
LAEILDYHSELLWEMIGNLDEMDLLMLGLLEMTLVVDMGMLSGGIEVVGNIPRSPVEVDILGRVIE